MDRFNIMSDPKYKDLQYMKDKIILLGLSGSHSYGTNNENSDIDIRGIQYNPIDVLLGLEKESQYISPTTDTTVYHLNKVIPLLASCNPNILEMLGLAEEDYIIVSPVGRQLIDNVDMFLSKDAIKSAFGGYARAQLKRLKNGESDGHGQKKDDNHLCKHAMHLMRLLISGRNILMTGKVRTRMDGLQLEFLKKIRRGDYFQNGRMVDQFYNLVETEENTLNDIYNKSKLPEKPDWNRIRRFLIDVNYKTVLREVGTVCQLKVDFQKNSV